jgi:hypothetical protein
MAKKYIKSLVTTSVVSRAVAVLALTVFGVFCAVAVSASPAKAGGSEPTVTVTSTAFNGVVLGGVATSQDIDTGKVTFLADVMMSQGVKITKRQSPKGCHWISGGFWNSGHDANGKLKWFRDNVPAQVCPSSKSPTGWVKTAGGMTGRKCFNPVKIKGPAPGPVVKGKVIMVRSFANLKMHLRATASVKVTAVCGYATASGFADLVLTLRAYIRSTGPVKTNLSGQATGRATAKASAELSCVVTPPVTTTVVTTTTGPPPPPPGTTTTTPPPPVQHSCTFSAIASKDDPYTARVTVTTDVASNNTFNWGDGTSASGGSVGIHTYPKPAPGPAGSGVTYTISVSASFPDGQTKSCGSNSAQFLVPAPSSNGNSGPPPPPAG